MPHTTRRHGMREHRGVLVTVARLLGLLCRLQDALPEKRKRGSSIALALEKLEAMDVACRDAIAPLHRQPSFDRHQVVLQSTCEPGERIAMEFMSHNLS